MLVNKDDQMTLILTDNSEYKSSNHHHKHLQSVRVDHSSQSTYSKTSRTKYSYTQ